MYNVHVMLYMHIQYLEITSVFDGQVGIIGVVSFALSFESVFQTVCVCVCVFVNTCV